MGPRPRGRGWEGEIDLHPEDHPLQWGHGREAVDGPAKVGMYVKFV